LDRKRKQLKASKSENDKKPKILDIKDKYLNKTNRFYKDIIEDDNLLKINMLNLIAVFILGNIFSLYINSKSPSFYLDNSLNLLFLSISLAIYFVLYMSLTILFYKFFYDIEYMSLYKILSFNTISFIFLSFIFILNVLIRSTMLYDFWIGFSFFAYVLLNFVVLKIYYKHSFMFNLLATIIFPLTIIWIGGLIL